MVATAQIEALSALKNVPSFTESVKSANAFPLRRQALEILQINVGKLCNLSCTHCHVEAGPDKTEENMSKATFDICLELAKNPSITTIDLTGGAPEMNPNLEWFIDAVSALGKRVIVRSNLTVLLLKKYDLTDCFVRNEVEIIASVPCYLEKNTDEQRGSNVFKKSVQVLQRLNERGYGFEGSNLRLHFVHNPVGWHLPPDQSKLEARYKEEFKTQFGIKFNQLFCITNMPISRYLDYLRLNKQYDTYMALLANAFNPATLDGLMCRNTLSISWDGKVYDCDFNQMLDLPIPGLGKRTISDLTVEELCKRPIATHNHCYGCTAGSGSSCQGALNA